MPVVEVDVAGPLAPGRRVKFTRSTAPDCTVLVAEGVVVGSVRSAGEWVALVAVSDGDAAALEVWL